MIERAYKRNFYRFRPSVPLYANVSICRVGGRETASRSKQVRILDISPGGLKFESDLDFPIFTDMALQFYIHTDNGVISFESELIHKACLLDAFSYGVRFVKKECDSFNMMKLFNGLSLQSSRHYIILKF